jgi:uncharacterized protein (DUF433 family)
MVQQYTPKQIEQRDGGYYVAGTRVSLDSVVYAYLNGDSLLGIVESYPALSLNQVTSAVDFYLANRPMIDAYLREQERLIDQMREEARRRNPDLHAKIAQAREKLKS